MQTSGPVERDVILPRGGAQSPTVDRFWSFSSRLHGAAEVRCSPSCCRETRGPRPGRAGPSSFPRSPVCSTCPLPRTPPLRRVRSYSGRNSSRPRFTDSFLLLSPLPACCPPRTDDSDTALACGVCNKDDTSPHGSADGDLAIFLLRVIGIPERERLGIEKHRRRLLEPDAMVLGVLLRLAPGPIRTSRQEATTGPEPEPYRNC